MWNSVAKPRETLDYGVELEKAWVFPPFPVPFGVPIPARSTKNWATIKPRTISRLPGAPGTSNNGTLNEVSGLPSKGANGAVTNKETLKLSGKSGSSPPTGPEPCPGADEVDEGIGTCPLMAACTSWFSCPKVKTTGYGLEVVRERFGG